MYTYNHLADILIDFVEYVRTNKKKRIVPEPERSHNVCLLGKGFFFLFDFLFFCVKCRLDGRIECNEEEHQTKKKKALKKTWTTKKKKNEIPYRIDEKVKNIRLVVTLWWIMYITFSTFLLIKRLLLVMTRKNKKKKGNHLSSHKVNVILFNI